MALPSPFLCRLLKSIAFCLVSFCAGNLSGPQFFIAAEVPDYHLYTVMWWRIKQTESIANYILFRLRIPPFWLAMPLLLL
jgi:hypothetical protein